MAKSIHRPEYGVLLRYVRDLRISSGRTQTELSTLLGRSQSFISDIERGNRRLDVLELRDICHHLGVEFVEAVAHIDDQIGQLKSTPKH